MIMPNSSVLIIGSTGFIGRHLSNALCAAGLQVTGLSRSPDGFLHENFYNYSAPFFNASDYRNLLKDKSFVVHCATTSTPSTSFAKPVKEIETNLSLTANLLEAIQDFPEIKLVYISSGGSLYSDSEGSSFDENSRVAPRSYHGVAKYASELFIKAFSEQFGNSCVIIRPSNVYGPGQPERDGFGIIPAAMGKALRNEPLQIWGDGIAARDYVYIDDLIDLCLKALFSGSQNTVDTVNACSGESVTLRQLVSLIEQAAGIVIKTEYLPAKPHLARSINMSPKHALHQYGWKPKTSLIEGLSVTWEDFIGPHSTFIK